MLHAKVIDNDFCGLNSIKFLKDLRYQLVLRRSQRNSDKRLPGVSWALALVEDCVEAILSRRFFRGDSFEAILSKLFRRFRQSNSVYVIPSKLDQLPKC